MRNRTILSLIEMLIMVMVFAVAAAICLRAFVWADLTSADSKAKAEAALMAQEAAELLQHYEGDVDKTVSELNERTDEGSWRTDIQLGDETAYLGSATVTVSDSSGEVLAVIPVKWQKTAGEEGTP